MIFDETTINKIDLVNNNGLSSYMNLASQQNHNVYEVFYNFLNEIKPKRILEIGTALGGFTQFLKNVSDESQLDINILSYDINEMGWYKNMIQTGIDVRVENIFDSSYQSIKQDVIDFIQQDGITIVLCDGGNKVGEFNILSNYIKQGDFIMAHDYVDTRENFNENYYNKIWNWHEISESDISQSCVKNNLSAYNKDVFDSVVWVCKIK